jgi:hypothetical protein
MCAAHLPLQRDERDPRVGKRVWLSAVVSWPVVIVVAVAHFTFDPFRSERGFDVLMLVLVLPTAL